MSVSLLILTFMSLHYRMSVIEMMKRKLMNTMVQDQDQHPVQDLAQNPTLDHVQGLVQGLGLDQDLALDLDLQEIDQGQGVEAVHGNVVHGLVVGHVRLGGGENPDLDRAVHITIGTNGIHISFALYLHVWYGTVIVTHVGKISVDASL